VKAAQGQDGPGGASTSVIDLGGGLDAPKSAPVEDNGLGQPTTNDVPEDLAKRVAAEAEKRQLDSLMEELREAIDKSEALQPFKDQLLLDITPEGLRIQIVDKQNRPMFSLGGTELKDYTVQILRELPQYLNTVPNRISLSGHTDAKPYSGARGYTNWELSADRANAARRALVAGGLQPDKVVRIIGLASSVLFDSENPFNPINRRISIIVMTKSAEAEALSTDAPDVDAARQAIESLPPDAPSPAAPPPAAPPTGAAPPTVKPAATPVASVNAAVRAAEAALEHSQPKGQIPRPAEGKSQ
jgi:chemotaxis protein MotB